MCSCVVLSLLRRIRMTTWRSRTTPGISKILEGEKIEDAFLTNEYPPHTYGGAGVHVDYLSRELAKLMEVEVRCFGDQQSLGTNPEVRGFEIATDSLYVSQAAAFRLRSGSALS